MKRTSSPGRSARADRGRRGKAPPRITILLVDDHGLVRQGVRALLEAEEDLVVVGEACDGRQGVALAAVLRPDVVLMDVAMPGLNGIEATRQILDATPATRILILSAHCDEEYVESVVRLGVAGYVLKDSSLEDLAAAIRTVHGRRQWFSAALAQCQDGRIAGSPQGQGRTPDRARVPLTAREAEILQLVAEGKASKQAALVLGISIKTVEKHRQSLMSKLDIHDVAGLTRYAIASGSIAGRDRRA